jgi:hypothetical protein
VNQLKENEKIIKLIAMLAFLAAMPLVFSETNGTISVNQTLNPVTGLWGATVTTTIPTNTTTTTAEVMTGASSPGNSTTTTRTTTTQSSLTTTTRTGSQATTTTLFAYAQANVQKPYTASELNSFITNNSVLKAAIESVVGRLSSAVDTKISEAVSSNLIINRNLVIGSNYSKLSLRIIYSGPETVRDMLVFERLPKSFAASADSITIETNVNKTVVEDDPSFLFRAPLMKTTDMIAIDYTINKKVGEEIMNQTELMVFAGGYRKDEISFMWTAIIAFIVSIIVIISVIFRHQLMDMLKPGSAKNYHYYKKQSPTEAVKSVLENIKNRVIEIITRKKQESKVAYRYVEPDKKE